MNFAFDPWAPGCVLHGLMPLSRAEPPTEGVATVSATHRGLFSFATSQLRLHVIDLNRARRNLRFVRSKVMVTQSPRVGRLTACPHCLCESLENVADPLLRTGKRRGHGRNRDSDLQSSINGRSTFECCPQCHERQVRNGFPHPRKKHASPPPSSVSARSNRDQYPARHR